MARGTMFHITNDPDNLGTMCASEFYEDVGSLHVEFVDDDQKEIADQNTECLAKMLEACGFPIFPDDEPANEDYKPAAFIIRTGGDDSLTAAKMRFFQPLLESLKKEVSELDLKTFATAGCNTYSLIYKINDDYSDAVYLETGEYGGSVYTMHEFIRNMDPDATYYVAANTVRMK